MSSNSKKTTITTTTKTKSKTSSAAAADDDVVVDATSNKRTTMTTMCSLLQQQINHSSIQDLSFGDFTQDELNTYLINKKLNNTNKAANQITEANESKVDNNKSDSQQNQHPTCKNREKEEEETTRSSSEPVNQSINSPPPSEFDIEFGFDLNPSVLLSASNKVVGEKSEHSKPPTSHRSSDATRPASSSISSLSSSLSSSDDSSTSIRDNDNNEYRHRVSKQQQQQQTVTANSSSVKNLRATVDLTTKTESRAAESSLSSSPPISSHSSTYSSSSPPPSSPPHSSTSSYSSSSPFSVPNTTNTSSSKMETVESRKSMENQTVGSISNNNNNNASQNEQRRNKKKKPPNYYQSAEYAAIIKLNGDLAAAEAAAAAAAAAAEENSTTTTSSSNNNHNDTASNTQETAGNISSKNNHYNAITTESSSKSDKQQSDSETSTKSEEPPTTNGDSKSQSVNEAEKAVTEAAKKLDKVDLNNESGSTSSDEQQKTEPATNTPTTTSAPSSKPSPWSSLFKSSAAPATSHQQQTNSSKQNGQKPAPKTPTTSSSSSTNLNGTGTSSSAASVSGDSEQDKTSVANLDVLKNLGTLLKQCELKHSAPALQPRGLSNRNNWCYVNATLQALLACPPFYNLLKTVYTKLKSANSSSLAMQHVPFVAALGRFISEFKVMVRSTSSTSSQSEQVVKNSSKELVIGESFECEYFYDVLSKSQSHMEFRPGRQEDAQEFLSFLLNRLHEEMVKCLESLNPPKQQPSQTQQTPLDYTKTNGKSNGYGETAAVNGGEIQEDDDWHEVGRKNRAFVTRKPEFKQSPLSDIFCGQFRSALSQPGVKDKDSVSLEPFFTLPLEIQSDSIRTVQQALEHFVQKEELSGFKHQETKQEIEAFKRISFEDLPPVLIIYLKCFVFDKHGGSQKLLKRLEFAIDLEISRELISPAQRSKLKDKKRSSYKLFAVEYHHGERATGGHYITDVYHPGIVAWVRYDDAHVRVLNNAQVLKSDDRKLIPYLLYYRRCDLI